MGSIEDSLLENIPQELISWIGLESRWIVKGAFLAERIFVLPKRELCSHIVGAYGVFSTNMCTKVAARREVLPVRQAGPTEIRYYTRGLR